MKSLKMFFVFLLLFLSSCTDGLKDIGALKTVFSKGTTKTNTKSDNGSPEEVSETGSSDNPIPEVTGPKANIAEMETTKLQAAIQKEPEYKIEDSEIDLLQNEGIISEADSAELQALK